MIKVTDENLRKYIHLMGQDVTTRSYDNMEYVLREFLSDYSNDIVKEIITDIAIGTVALENRK
jgi:hypothetical protein